MLQKLTDAIVEMQEQEALDTTDELLKNGTDPIEVFDACRAAMEKVGQKFEAGQFFVPELILAGEILREITGKVKPYLSQDSDSEKLGKVLIGTVEGDIHDIGKDIVVFMLDINGFEVMDLGVDVPPDRFVEAALEFKPDVVGLSGFLTLAYDPMKETIEKLKAAGFENAHYMIGGGQIDDQIRDYTGADAAGRDAMSAVTLSKQWVQGG